MASGTITDIQRFSLHDGPGIRTTVFLKGCNLRCRWCHNPETLSRGRQIQFFPDKCIGCGACLTVCPHGAHRVVEGRREFLRELCRSCGACAEACCAEALVLVGRNVTTDEVLEEVLRDRPYYEQSEGGMTLSGGEPLAQREFCLDLLARAREAGVHTAIETNLDWPWQAVAEAAALCDLVMADLKLMDPAAHERWTGRPNERILASLRRLGETGVELVVRTPIIPGVNDSEAELARAGEFLAAVPNVRYYELLAYHALGRGKYESLGIDYELADAEAPSPELLGRLVRAAARDRLEVRCGAAKDDG